MSSTDESDEPAEPASDEERDRLEWESNAPNAYEWTQRAFEHLQAGKLKVDIAEREGIRTVTASGACPRCGHEVAYTEVLTVSLAAAAAHRLSPDGEHEPRYASVDIRCQCEGPSHAGRPDGRTGGCGILFTVKAKVHDLR